MALAQLAEDAPVVPLVYPEGAYAYAPEAYDGWIYVKGEGILDKRSFLANDPSRAGAADAPIGSPLATGDDDGIGDWAWITLGALAVAVVGGIRGIRPEAEHALNSGEERSRRSGADATLAA